MDKRAYVIEYADKDLTVVLVDDGEKQAIMTGSADTLPSGLAEADMYMHDYRRRGYEVIGLRSAVAEEESEGGNHLRLWQNIETGESVPAPLGKEWDPAGAFA